MAGAAILAATAILTFWLSPMVTGRFDDDSRIWSAIGTTLLVWGVRRVSRWGREEP